MDFNPKTAIHPKESKEDWERLDDMVREDNASRKAKQELHDLDEEEINQEFYQKMNSKKQPTEASEREWKELDKKMQSRSPLEDKRERVKRLREEKAIKAEEKKLDAELYEEDHPIRSKFKKVGNIIAGGIKEIPQRASRGGSRATLAYRRENRQYKSEARKMRKEVVEPAGFTSKLMFGENRVPNRSRYVGSGEFAGTSDPLSNFSSGILGLPRVRQDTTIEGSIRKGQRKPRKQKEVAIPKLQETQLSAFGKRLWRFRL